jgi:hypothetical protein
MLDLPTSRSRIASREIQNGLWESLLTCVSNHDYLLHMNCCPETGQAVLKLDTNVAHDFDQMRIK